MALIVKRGALCEMFVRLRAARQAGRVAEFSEPNDYEAGMVLI